MSLTKRLRVLWAALTQQWEAHECDSCGVSWWMDMRIETDAPLRCMACEAKAFEGWLLDYERRQAQTGQKEIA